MVVIKNPKRWYIKLFTLGENFSLRNFSDNSKKFVLNALGLFIVVTFTFYVESVGDEFEKREEYLDVVKGIQEEINDVLSFTDNYIDDTNLYSEILLEQYRKWEVNNDSIFVDYLDDGYLFIPLNLVFEHRSYNPFKPKNLKYTLFQKGQLDFALINQNLSIKIIEIYEGNKLKKLYEYTAEYDPDILRRFRKIMYQKWSNELPYVDVEDEEFWINNRRYIQNDRELKSLVFERLSLWEYTLKENLIEYKTSVEQGKQMLDSLISAMENEKYFLYWKID